MSRPEIDVFAVTNALSSINMTLWIDTSGPDSQLEEHVHRGLAGMKMPTVWPTLGILLAGNLMEKGFHGIGGSF